MYAAGEEEKQFYLKWPWNLVVYILLVVLFRVFSVPLILLLMWWNKKQQPGGPAEGYCMQRARGQLIQLVWAAVALLMAAAGAAYLTISWNADKTGGDYMEYIKLSAAGLLVVGGVLVAGVSGLHWFAGCFLPGEKPAGSVHPESAALSGGSAAGEGAVCHGG